MLSLSKEIALCGLKFKVKGGSSEIGSCIFKYLKTLPPSTKNVTFYSDRCGGQNLNKFMAAMCMIAVQEIEHLKTIDLKFLVVGHSEMECDSMHAAISREFKRIGKSTWPEDWKNIARGARRKGDKPYVVHSLELHEIYDFKKFVEQNMSVKKTDENGQIALWQKMCWLRFEKAQRFIMKFKDTFTGDFRILDFNKKARRNIKTDIALATLYKKPLPISKAKYEDLLSLFATKPPALSEVYKPFYLSLPYDGKSKDTYGEDDLTDMED